LKIVIIKRANPKLLAMRILVVIGWAAIAIALSGCPLLFIGGLGYTGYQYHEKEGVFAPGQPLGGPLPEDQNKKQDNPNAPAPPPTDNNIE